MMFYLCKICDVKNYSCKHSFSNVPCYSHPKKGLLTECGRCYWKFVCITNGNITDVEYDKWCYKNGVKPCTEE